MVNVISVDWEKLAHWSNYLAAAYNTEKVGRRVGEVLGKLLIIDLGVRPQDIHAIGHSLGAHVVGHIGRTMEEVGNKGKIYRVTGIPFLILCDCTLQCDKNMEYFNEKFSAYLKGCNCRILVL